MLHSTREFQGNIINTVITLSLGTDMGIEYVMAGRCISYWGPIERINEDLQLHYYNCKLNYV